MCLELTGALFIQVKLTKISYIGTLFQIGFIQHSCLFRIGLDGFHCTCYVRTVLMSSAFVEIDQYSNRIICFIQPILVSIFMDLFHCNTFIAVR